MGLLEMDIPYRAVLLEKISYGIMDLPFSRGSMADRGNY